MCDKIKVYNSESSRRSMHGSIWIPLPPPLVARFCQSSLQVCMLQVALGAVCRAVLMTGQRWGGDTGRGRYLSTTICGVDKLMRAIGCIDADRSDKSLS